MSDFNFGETPSFSFGGFNQESTFGKNTETTSFGGFSFGEDKNTDTKNSKENTNKKKENEFGFNFGQDNSAFAFTNKPETVTDLSESVENEDEEEETDFNDAVEENIKEKKQDSGFNFEKDQKEDIETETDFNDSKEVIVEEEDEEEEKHTFANLEPKTNFENNDELDNKITIDSTENDLDIESKFKLFHELHEVFVGLQATDDVYDATRLYRVILTTYISENKSKDLSKLKFQLQVLHLFEALSSEQKLPQLIEWVQKYFTKAPGSDPLLLIYHQLFQGRASEAKILLINYFAEKYGGKSLNEREEDTYYFMIYEYLVKMPILHSKQNPDDYFQLVEEWKHDLNEIRSAFNKTIKEKELDSILKIMSGDENEIDSIGKKYKFSWVEILICKYLFIGIKSVFIRELVVEQKTQTDLFYFLFDEDQVIKILKENIFDKWFLAHFSDLLHHEGKISKEVRDKNLVSYGESIFQNYWKISMDYLLDYKKDFIKKIPITSNYKLEKIKSYCIENNIPYDDLFNIYGKNFNKGYFLLKGNDESKKIQAMNELIEEYLKGNYIESYDFDFITKFNQFLKDKKSISIRELFNSPMRFWILILIHSLEILDTLNKNDTFFLLEKLTNLCLSENRDVYLKDITQSTLQEIRYSLLINQSKTIFYQ